MIGAFRKNHRSPVGIGIISKGYRKMGGISDDHICLRDILHHTHGRHLALFLPDPSFDLRIALCLLILVLDFLFTHAQILLILPPLVEIVKSSQKNKGGPHRVHQRHRSVPDIHESRLYRSIHQTCKLVDSPLYVAVDHPGQDGNLNHRF